MFAQDFADQQKFTLAADPRGKAQQTLERNMSGFHVQPERAGIQFDSDCFVHV